MFERSTLKWLTIGIGVKRWIFLWFVSLVLIISGVTTFLLSFGQLTTASPLAGVTLSLSGLILIMLSIYKLSRNILAPYRVHQHGRVIDVVYAHSRRQKGLKVVAIGGGTGLPAVLRGMKAYTTNITAVVTVADDGGSSGRLRRDLGVLPPGDIRNNIVALADDESLMTQLFQYRFDTGDLDGHSFGNLFIAALAGISGNLEIALPEIERVLNIQGRVLPATLEDIDLVADVRLNGKNRSMRIQGESKISAMRGYIQQIALTPHKPTAYDESVRAILDASLIVIGPGSLFTSILPNLLVDGITDALRRSNALKVYICNVATQPGETQNFDVADHVLALEQYIGRGAFQVVLANNARPRANINTHYVDLIPANHPVLQRYYIHYTDLTDASQPWRHDPKKLATALLDILETQKPGNTDATSVPVSINTSESYN
jgi:uncharacterized cofD-like protein